MRFLSMIRTDAQFVITDRAQTLHVHALDRAWTVTMFWYALTEIGTGCTGAGLKARRNRIKQKIFTVIFTEIFMEIFTEKRDPRRI